jgi:hypothetical protein
VISEAKKAELDQIADLREPSMRPAQKPVTLQSLDERLTIVEGFVKAFLEPKAEEQNG